jgi:hypothetical protein
MDLAAEQKDPIERMKYVTTFFVNNFILFCFILFL